MGRMGPRSCSTFSLPTEGFGNTCSSPPAPRLRPRSLSSLAAPVFRINVDALVGAEETDVDTGQAVSSDCIDLSVVSAYLHPQSRMHSKAAVSPFSSTLQDRGHDLQLQFENTYSSLKRHATPSQTSRVTSVSTPTAIHEPLPKNACSSQAPPPALQYTGQHQSKGSEMTDASRDGAEEDSQEFYI